MIELKGLGKEFGGEWAVRDVSVRVPAGEIFGLVGPNGAGKSTTIRMMTGILVPSRGEVLIGGHDIVKEALEAKALTGYIPDRPFFYEKLTAREFLLFVASLYRMEGKDAVRRAKELLGIMGLAEREDSLIESYSQGMRQRLLFASALIHAPRVIVIDEPFVGLDPFGILLVKDTMKRLAGQGVAVFLATHSLHIAGELCDRVGLINRGRLAALKGRDELMRLEGGLEEFFLRTARDEG